MAYTPRTPDEALTVACLLLADITGECPASRFEEGMLDRCPEECSDDIGACWQEWLLSGRPYTMCADALPPADLLDDIQTAPGDGARRDGREVPE